MPGNSNEKKIDLIKIIEDLDIMNDALTEARRLALDLFREETARKSS